MTDLIKQYQAMFTAGGGVSPVPQDLGDYNFGSKDPDNKYCPFQWDVSKLPSAKTLKPFDSSIQDQGSFSSCVGNGWAKNLEILLNQQASPLEISREFIYYNARARYSPTSVIDNGSSAFVAAAQMTKLGAASEFLWPYGGNTINLKPSDAAYADGLTRLVGRYERVGTNTYTWKTGEIVARDFIKDVKVAINCGMPVTFCANLIESFYYIKGPLSTHKAQYNPTTFIQPTTPGYIGGHCMCIVGYDDSLGGFIVENSWGSTWGDNGFVLLTYEGLSATQFDSFVARSFNGVTYNIPDELYIWDAQQRVVSMDFDGLPGQIYRLYQAAFNRRPDWGGVGYHLYYANNGRSMDQVADNFTASPEYVALYGNTDSRRFVQLLYELALYRNPDPDGWDYHVNLLDSGLATRGQVLRGFAESPENKANCMFFYGTDGVKYYPYTP